jgi:hypothetical protein
MNFTKKSLIEQTIKYIFIFIVVGLFWSKIEQGINNAAISGKLEAIGVVMGIVSLCAITGYFSFSYNVVGKKFVSRMFGYLCAFFLTIPLILSWLILYFIAVVWIPEMKIIWALILGTLYLGTLIFDYLDTLRMGLDVAATSFFEKGNLQIGGDHLSSTIHYLKGGQRLPYANFLIGQAMVELGRQKNDQLLINSGKYVLDNQLSQREVDEFTADVFSKFGETNKKVAQIVLDLKKGQNQNVSDSLIANLFELVKEK